MYYVNGVHLEKKACFCLNAFYQSINISANSSAKSTANLKTRTFLKFLGQAEFKTDLWFEIWPRFERYIEGEKMDHLRYVKTKQNINLS